MHSIQRITMAFPTDNELQPYLTLAGTIISVATLGFVMNVAKLMSDAAKMRAEVLEERVKKSEEDVRWTEKWTEREKARLNDEIVNLRAQVTASLSSAGVTTTLEAREAVEHLSQEVREMITSRLGELRKLLAERDTVPDEGHVESAVDLQLGRGYMATGHWSLAAQYFGTYLSRNPDDWQAQYARGVAYSNSREGRSSNLSALRSYNEAIALALEPTAEVDDNYHARLFIYRGAILKRLGRLDEAKCDLELGLSLASADYEKADATYNLVCVHAMRGDKKQLLETLNNALSLVDRVYVALGARSHMDDYFSKYARDEDILKALARLE
jgi:Tfp pilus assembly protein PilF